MQTIFILLVSTVILGAARIVTLEDLYHGLIDLPTLKYDEPEYICKDSPVDIVLVIDSSRSIKEFDFKEQIEFLVEFATLFDIHPTKVRFAAVSFGQTVITQGAFNFNKYNSTEEVQWGLRRIKYEGVKFGEETNTALALKYARERYFVRARPEAKKLAIVLTDGRSTDPRKTQEEAALIKSGNVTMVAIGIGKRISLEELKGIASNSDLVFTVDKHSLLETIQKKLILKTCAEVEFVTKEPPLQKDEDVKIVTTELQTQEIEVTTTEPPIENKVTTTESSTRNDRFITTISPTPNNRVTTEPQNDTEKNASNDCDGLLDINYVFNPSLIGSQRIMTFIENMVTSRALANGDVRVGVITVPVQDINGFRLNHYETKKKMKKHFTEYKINLMARQLKDLRLKAFLPINGGRPNARRIGVVFLRGKLDDVIPTIVEATLAQASGIEMYVVAFKDSDSRTVIDHIANDFKHVMLASSAMDFRSLSEVFMQFICKE